MTPAMIEQAKKKNISNVTFVVGDCENSPFVGLKVEKFEIRKGMRMHCVVRKA